MIDHDADREGVELEYGTLLEIHAEPIPDFVPLYKDDPSGPHPWLLSINQTLNESYKKPAVVSIETKKGFYEEEDARFQLGMWIAAWQNWVAAFWSKEKLVCTPLPSLIVFRHELWLY
ncbi:hypothetical protein BDV96DRAFT_655651 [Lophiotrema nucula]|uniref:PD-(D/E)XK nuclease-like domain-containing protein n=1 Tax=Lophiotrema nucula TaxID=690887 RepID=A0A6A5YFG2_9PLEO|nr:hypothetical protein BDV96DRAFT_655651 [Lophiotrema nucula]